MSIHSQQKGCCISYNFPKLSWNTSPDWHCKNPRKHQSWSHAQRLWLININHIVLHQRKPSSEIARISTSALPSDAMMKRSNSVAPAEDFSASKWSWSLSNSGDQRSVGFCLASTFLYMKPAEIFARSIGSQHFFGTEKHFESLGVALLWWLITSMLCYNSHWLYIPVPLRNGSVNPRHWFRRQHRMLLQLPQPW